MSLKEIKQNKRQIKIVQKEPSSGPTSNERYENTTNDLHFSLSSL